MRQQVIDFINTVSLGGFTLSREIPWDSDGSPLYIKNLKKIYVDAVQYANTPIVRALNGLSISNEVTSVTVYLACDAKQLPSNYDSLISDLKKAKDITTISGINNRECDVTTETQADMLITELEFRFTKIST
jgi:hypothetical protein